MDENVRKKILKTFDDSHEGDLLFEELMAVSSSYDVRAVVSASIALLMKRVKSEKGLHLIANSLLDVTKKDMENIHGCDSDNRREADKDSQKRIACDS